MKVMPITGAGIPTNGGRGMKQILANHKRLKVSHFDDVSKLTVFMDSSRISAIENVQFLDSEVSNSIKTAMDSRDWDTLISYTHKDPLKVLQAIYTIPDQKDKSQVFIRFLQQAKELGTEEEMLYTTYLNTCFAGDLDLLNLIFYQDSILREVPDNFGVHFPWLTDEYLVQAVIESENGYLISGILKASQKQNEQAVMALLERGDLSKDENLLLRIAASRPDPFLINILLKDDNVISRGVLESFQLSTSWEAAELIFNAGLKDAIARGSSTDVKEFFKIAHKYPGHMDLDPAIRAAFSAHRFDLVGALARLGLSHNVNDALKLLISSDAELLRVLDESGISILDYKAVIRKCIQLGRGETLVKLSALYPHEFLSGISGITSQTYQIQFMKRFLQQIESSNPTYPFLEVLRWIASYGDSRLLNALQKMKIKASQRTIKIIGDQQSHVHAGIIDLFLMHEFESANALVMMLHSPSDLDLLSNFADYIRIHDNIAASNLERAVDKAKFITNE